MAERKKSSTRFASYININLSARGGSLPTLHPALPSSLGTTANVQRALPTKHCLPTPALAPWIGAISPAATIVVHQRSHIPGEREEEKPRVRAEKCISNAATREFRETTPTLKRPGGFIVTSGPVSVIRASPGGGVPTVHQRMRVRAHAKSGRLLERARCIIECR